MACFTSSTVGTTLPMLGLCTPSSISTIVVGHSCSYSFEVIFPQCIYTYLIIYLFCVLKVNDFARNEHFSRLGYAGYSLYRRVC